MSNLDAAPRVSLGGGAVTATTKPVQQVFPGKEVLLGETTKVRRLLPNLGRRLVGPWCFVDHYGPQDIADGFGMRVPPHPHIGLQTVSWLLDGVVHHRDSLGSDQQIRPGGLGLMTAGRAIAHAEYSPVPHPALLHGVQLWVALPDAHRDTQPSWTYHTELPVLTDVGVTVTVILGSLAGVRSPGRTYSPLVGAEITMAPGASAVLPLEPGFEHAVLVMSGSAAIDDVPLLPGSMLYLGSSRSHLSLRVTPDGAEPTRLMLLGGAPFEERIVMWWNFVARTGEEIAAARSDWSEGHRFGTVSGGGPPLAAPPLPPGTLKPGGATR